MLRLKAPSDILQGMRSPSFDGGQCNLLTLRYVYPSHNEKLAFDPFKRVFASFDA